MRSRLVPEGFRLDQKQLRLVALVAGCALLVFCVAFLSPVSYGESDSLLDLVVSQAILEHQTIQLDAYVDGIIPQMQRLPYEVVEHDGHSYSMYPLGSPVFSLPFVLMANLMGRDMAIVEQNLRLQNDLSALLCALIFLVFYWIGRHYVGPGTSLLIALVSVLGSAVVSSVGTALWNVDLTLLFLALGVLLLARYDTCRARAWDPYLLGFVLLAAFSCRPTSALFMVVALGYLWSTQRGDAPKATLTAVALLLLFVGFSWLEFGRLLPDYYVDMPLHWLAGRQVVPRLLGFAALILVLIFAYLWRTQAKHRVKLVIVGCALLLLALGINLLNSGSLLPDTLLGVERADGRRAGIGQALYGILLSPGRGLLVFSPFFIPVLVGSLLFWGELRSRKLAAAMLAFLGLHLLGLAFSRVWSGGWAFGPRLLAEIIPALVLLTFVVWRAVSTQAGAHWQRFGAASYLVLGVAAILINSYQGLWNLNTLRWNGELAPNIDWHGEYLFDWRYPQFLATGQSLCDRNREHIHDSLLRGSIDPSVYHLGDSITYESGIDDMEYALSPGQDLGSKNAAFAGWLAPHERFRWSACSSSQVIFELGDVGVTASDLQLEITSGSSGVQQVGVYVNGIHVGDRTFPGPETPAVTRTIPFDGSLLRPNALNEIEFFVPQAASPEKGDDRALGLALRRLRLNTVE